ncbi:FeoA family protein [Mycolicibacterium farcinogenes]|uniref:Ferrous iron transport protein A n=1 Tax=Mycolicibacterium farcinogenes TaxID=1802 RepID=A0ACD1F9P0_MYCFR|nr:FeoA family protein [Mycolicibacterium farcinogenes]QZH63750.1 ferrous iron transport protein A [Mycolicibacterium farcinogenes]
MYTPEQCRILSDLPVGSCATIVRISDESPDCVALRLRHLGFRPGYAVEPIRVAPLGDPAVYRILGYDMCLRRREARHILVTVVS